MKKRNVACVLFMLLMASAIYAQNSFHDENNARFHHVLLISIDGMHAVDYRNCSKGISAVNNGEPYCPNLASLGDAGVNYLEASTSKPSDSFPGLMALVSGGSPRTVGAFYDVAYDRSLDPPAKTTGNGVAAGSCIAGAPPLGATTEYEEGIDLDQSQLNGGAPGADLADGGVKAIDAPRLVRDPAKNCAPVYPWNFVRTNTIFGVLHREGRYTAWSDKHPSYSAVSGPGDGSNVDDYYSPEINSTVVSLPGVTTPTGLSCATIRDPSQTGAWTDSFQNIQCYDTLKVNAILNEIDGKSHDGKRPTHVPNLFGMNFQVVSVGQKLIEKNVGTGGYLDNTGTPTPELLEEIQFVDASIGRMVAELKRRNLYESTLVVITAKHGQSPVDPKRFFPIPGPVGNNGTTPADLLASFLPESESPTNTTGIGPTQDDISLLWLSDSSQTSNAISILEDNAAKAGIGEILSGHALEQMFNAPGLPPNGDPRSPDIIVVPNAGVVYTGSSKKLSEHGGFGHDDTSVMLLIANPEFRSETITTPVATAQVAPTILKFLGLDPAKLDAVRSEGTQVLPGLPVEVRERR